MENSMNNNFIYSLHRDEDRVMHSKSDNIEIMINDEADEVIEELLRIAYVILNIVYLKEFL